MQIKEFDQLLKRVNFEDSNEIKHRLLTVIEKYIDSVLKSDSPAITSEKNETEVKEDTYSSEANVNTKPQAAGMIEIAESLSLNPIVEMDKEDVSAINESESDTALDTEEEPVVRELAKEIASPDPILEQSTSSLQDATSKEAEESFHKEDVVEVQEELQVSEEESSVLDNTTPSDLEEQQSSLEPVNEFVETFNLISTTKDTHIEEIKKRGAVLFREKRSYMLGLCLEDELLALAKTAKLESLPKHVREHLTKDGFISANVASVSEITKKSRARMIDITLTNMELLAEDNPIAQSVTNFLYHGILPDHVKEKEEKQQAEIQEAKEVSLSQPEETPVKQEESALQKDVYEAQFQVDPRFISIFAASKENAMQQEYGLRKEGTDAKLYAISSANQSSVLVAVQPSTTLPQGSWSAKLTDYTIMEGNTIHFVLKLTPFQPTPPTNKETSNESVAVKAQNVEVLAKGEVPADFPLSNQLHIQLVPKASEMFSLQQAKAMIGKDINLISQNGSPKLSLVFDIFSMGTAKEALSQEKLREAKWTARLVDIDVKEVENGKELIATFDRIQEVDVFEYEMEEPLSVAYFLSITEELFVKRNQELAERHHAQKQALDQEKAKEQTTNQNPKTVQEALKSNYDPELARKIANPHEDYSRSYNALINSQQTDMSSAIKSITSSYNPASAQALMEKVSPPITGAISETLEQTGIRIQKEQQINAKTESAPQPSTTAIVGNLQDGAGNLSQKDTAIPFLTNYAVQSWSKSIGKRVNLVSSLDFGSGPITSKTVSIVGKDGKPFAQGKVPMNEALLLDGNEHSAVIMGIEHAEPQEGKLMIVLRLGDFQKKVA